MKKNLVLMTALSVALAFGTPVMASDSLPFKDVSPRHYEAISELYHSNVIKGINETEFGVEKPLKRGDAAVISYNYDLKNQKFISIQDLALKSGYEDKIIQRINSMNSEFYPHFGGPKNLDELQYKFYMTPTNFVMYLNPYEYAPYAAGIREFSMPYSWIR